MSKIFVVSDLWLNRPYGDFSGLSSYAYNDIIVENWNKTVGNKDEVYILGGLGISDMYHILLKLNGTIHVLNNFYTDDEIYFRDMIKKSIDLSPDIKVKEKIIFEDEQIMALPKHDVILSYFPLVEWYGSDNGTFLFHGFYSDSDLSKNRISCKSNDWEFKPISINEIKSNLKKIRKNL